MTAPDTWLTEPLDWNTDFTTVADMPFLEGRSVRIKEVLAIQWDEKPRRAFNLRIDDERSAVYTVQHPDKLVMLCSEDGHGDECECRAIVRKYISTDPK